MLHDLSPWPKLLSPTPWKFYYLPHSTQNLCHPLEILLCLPSPPQPKIYFTPWKFYFRLGALPSTLRALPRPCSTGIIERMITTNKAICRDLKRAADSLRNRLTIINNFLPVQAGVLCGHYLEEDSSKYSAAFLNSLAACQPL